MRVNIWMRSMRLQMAGLWDLILAGREVEVLRLLAAGHSNRAIAKTLFISPTPRCATSATSSPRPAWPTAPRPPPTPPATAWPDSSIL
jgi:hypothetical protein